MKTKLILLAVVAGGSMFAQTRFSVRVGVGDRGYDRSYADRYQGYDRPSYDSSYGYREQAYGSFGYDPEREHTRTEWQALRRHQMEEHFQYGPSEELFQHHLQERRNLEHEQWHERHGDRDAGYGPGHESAEDGYRYGHRH